MFVSWGGGREEDRETFPWKLCLEAHCICNGPLGVVTVASPPTLTFYCWIHKDKIRLSHGILLQPLPSSQVYHISFNFSLLLHVQLKFIWPKATVKICIRWILPCMYLLLWWTFRLESHMPHLKMTCIGIWGTLTVLLFWVLFSSVLSTICLRQWSFTVPQACQADAIQLLVE